ncbi:MAG: ribosome small subunit-dependent GTPase A [Eubacteriales bacterium]|nr:ribosome small subunit-dependent GTPase A [Eubacteriales bacterium]MDD3881423.1 ribosome small subunit-dependent GTPase A [Eubacteriales bacterium]
MIDLKEYGYFGGDESIARVTAVHKERWEIVSRFGLSGAKLKASVYYQEGSDALYPAVGDYVRIAYNESGDSIITETLPRTSCFSRSDFSGHALGYVKTIKAQVVAANFDTVFIVSSLNNDFNASRLERYLTLAWNSGAVPVIILTKLDLCENPWELIESAKSAAMGADVYAISSVTGEGLSALEKYMTTGKTLVFLGMSGVGKSSLLNALAGETLMKVNVTRQIDESKGRHTTTHRQMFRLPSGAIVIDTPGMREIGMWDVNEGLENAFPDVERLLTECRFSDCRHISEPGCAVLAALESGELTQERWISYQTLKNEALFAKSKSAREQKRAFKKSVAVQSKQIEKHKRFLEKQSEY